MIERERQNVSGWPPLDDLVARAGEGWKLVALEWEREVEAGRAAPNAGAVEIPYGFRASADGFHMIDEPTERRALMIVLNSIVDDRPLSQAAADLNRAGFLTRQGQRWTSAAVFDMLPRLIEASPAILTSPDWIKQRDQRASRA